MRGSAKRRRQRPQRAVSNYVKGRPTYPTSIITALTQHTNLQKHVKDGKDYIIADVACGTGLSSELFFQAGFKVIGVEPNDTMRAATPQHALYTTISGSAECTNLPDASVDMVTTFQAAHWFDMPAFLKECRRVLRRGRSGFVVMAWNDHDVVETPFHQAYTRICRATNDYLQITAMARTDQLAKSFFNEIPYSVAKFPNRQIMTLGGLTSRFFSSSWAPPTDTPEYLEKHQQLSDLFDCYKIPIGTIDHRMEELIYDGLANETPPTPDLPVIEFQYETLVYYGDVMQTEEPEEQVWKWLFDTHCHLTDEQDVEKRINGTKSLKIGGLALMGTQPSDWSAVESLQTGSPGKQIVSAFGLHPWFTNVGKANDWQAELRQRLIRNKACIVGEIGLDRVATDPSTCTDSRRASGKIYDWHAQMEMFKHQMNLAAELDKPVSVHLVHATGPMLKLLNSLPRLPPRIQFHSYSGSAETITAMLKNPKLAQRCYFSFSHHINARSSKFPELVKAVPRDRILLESDIHSPEGVDDLMMRVCREVADARGWTVLDAAKQTYANAQAFYGIEAMSSRLE